MALPLGRCETQASRHEVVSARLMYGTVSSPRRCGWRSLNARRTITRRATMQLHARRRRVPHIPHGHWEVEARSCGPAHTASASMRARAGVMAAAEFSGSRLRAPPRPSSRCGDRNALSQARTLSKPRCWSAPSPAARRDTCRRPPHAVTRSSCDAPGLRRMIPARPGGRVVAVRPALAAPVAPRPAYVQWLAVAARLRSEALTVMGFSVTGKTFILTAAAGLGTVDSRG